MTSAPIPGDEQGRLSALRAYDVLDTLPEAAYDDITRLAAYICDTPISLVSLVDENRQWFKSALGLDVRETPRDQAFCAHAILEPGSVLVVEDASKDPRFSALAPVVGELGVRFYAGAPLVTSEGLALGTLCVIDTKPNRLSADQAAALQALARQVIAQLELRRSVNLLEDQARELETSRSRVVRSRDELAGICRLLEDQASMMERDLNRAEIIQRSLLPHSAPRLKGVSLHTFYRPGHNIGGDLFDLVVVDERYLVLVIADAAGHGVSAAMISMLFKNRLKFTDESGRPYRPCEALGRLNDAMQSDKPAPGVFVTALYCLVDMQERSLLLGSAGHPPLILLRDDHQTELMPHTGPALGLYAEAQYGEHSATLAEGDRVLLYTDGLFDAAGGTVAPTPETIADALGGISESHNILGQLLAQVSDGEDTGDRDDVSMILLEVGSGENQLDEPVDLHIHATGGEREEPKILYAETEHTTFLTLDGRVTWVCGQALLDSALSVLDADRDLVIDLAHCEYLDSTLLGTLHELAEVAKQAAATLRLQNVPQALIDAFAELSMSEVLDCITSEPVALPERQRRVQLPEHSRGAHQRRLLRAHEMLAELSDENRREFSGVIEALRNEPD